MKTISEKIREEFSRDLYWTKIKFNSDDNNKSTQVFACATFEYLHDYFTISGNVKLSDGQFNEWLKIVEKKWLTLGENIFNQDVHYDVYATTKEGEANGIDFLIKITN